VHDKFSKYTRRWVSAPYFSKKEECHENIIPDFTRLHATGRRAKSGLKKP